MSVRLSIRPSVAYIANNSRTQRPSLPKFERKLPHLWCDSHTSFKVKRSKIKVTGSINAHTHRAPYLLYSIVSYTSASDWPMHTIKLCSVLFGVVVHAAGAVINKIHWCVVVCAAKGHANCDLLLHRRPCIVNRTSLRKPDIGRESRFLPTPPAFNASVKGRGVLVGILPQRMMRKNWNGVAIRRWKNNWRYVYSFRQNTRTWRTPGRTDRRTPLTAWRHRPRLCITSRRKNRKLDQK